VLENARTNHKDHIFPKREFGSKKDLNSVLNITWMSEETNTKIKRYEKPSEYIPRFISEKYGNNEKEFLKVLKTHLINSNTYHYMLQNNFEGFIAEREKQVLLRIKELIGLEGEVIENEGLISPERLFSNKVIIWNTIKSCEDYIYWIDKYFSKEGLELLVQSLDKAKVKTVKILTSVDKADESLRRLFKDFRNEMKNNQTFCELRVIVDSKLKSSIHDRWIVSKNNSFNIPSPDVVARGQYSEVKKTDNTPPFDDWWNKSSVSSPAASGNPHPCI
jgi:hypothetical protein